LAILAIVTGLLLVVVLALLSFVQRALVKGRAVALVDPEEQRYRRNTRRLLWLIVLAMAYGGALRYLRTLTGTAMLDGGIGVALGLYICAHPAANAVNVLFYERDILRHLSERSVIRWLALNLLVLVAGWMVIYGGIIRLMDRPA
jgi:hypothetical protein